MTQTLTPILAAHPFFHGFDARTLNLVAGCARNVQFEREHYLFHEGEAANAFYLIRSGKVALETSAAPHRPVIIETIEPNEVLGWSWLFPPYRWHFTARAIEPVHALLLDGACLRAKGEADHDLGYELVRCAAQILMQRLQATRLQLLDMYYVDTD